MKINYPNIVKNGTFTWGSNEVGRSFSGAAATAVKDYKAQLGVSFGFTGQSFAIPTKDANLKPLYIKYIKNYVDAFIEIAHDIKYPDPLDKNLWFYENGPFMITRIGCGLAGFKDEQIAPLFNKASSNCYFDEAWKPYLSEICPDGIPRLYWGSYD